MAVFVAGGESHEGVDGFADSFGVKCHRAGLSCILDLDCIQRMLGYGGVVLGNFQIHLAVIIKIKPCERGSSDLIGIASQRSDSLALHISRGRGVDGCAGSKWTSCAGTARQKTA